MSDDLARNCADVAGAAGDAVGWFERNRDEVGTTYKECRREFRYNAMLLRQLERAARQPMAVGVFGPSQVGKSYLVSALARKGTQPLYTVLGGQTVDFLKDMNPDEDQEATGLVTRFSLRPSSAPNSHPVTVRLLSQTDLIKILTNTYFSDFDPAKEEPPLAKDVDDALAAAESQVRSAPVDGLGEVDIDDLRRYFESQFKVRQTYRVLDDTQYWPRLEELAPRLALADRIKLYGFLWGRLPEFDKVYAALYGVLERMGFPETAYCPLATVIPKNDSIIAVGALAGLERTADPPIEIVGDNGRRTQATRAQLAAIVAELVITIKDQPWTYFGHTDLLDFPGARSRDLLEDPTGYVKKPGNVPYLFRRGKVAYLFDRYCAQMELTSMLLCLSPGNQEVRTMAGLVGAWVRAFQGDSAEERARKPTALFMVLTKFDRRFEEAAGRAENSDERWTSAISTTLTGLFGTGRDNWVKEWRPGEAFNNVFWMRNPYFRAPGLMKYEDQRNEVALLEPDRIARMKVEYKDNELVRRHVRDREKAWDEALKLNDGGISYLANELEPVCRPELKLVQLRKRLTDIQKHLHELIAEYHVTGSQEDEVAKRRKAAETALRGLRSAIAGQRFMHLIAELQLSSRDLRYAFHRRQVGHGSQAPAIVGPRPDADTILDDILGDGAAGAKSGSSPRPDPLVELATVAIEQWSSRMQRLSQQPNMLEFLGVNAETVETIARELVAAGERLDLQRQVAEAMKATKPALDGGFATLPKISLAAVEGINRFVSRLGEDRLPAEQRARNGGKPVFQPKPRIDSLSTLPEAGDNYCERYIRDWLNCFLAVTERNARGPAKRRFKVEESAALATIVTRLA